MDDNPLNYKAGFVAVTGKPNVGKSTLVNCLLGQKIAAVTARPQTTRRRQLGILTLETAQMVFIDTPGVHKARHKLGEAMNQEAAGSLQDCDLALFVVDASQSPDDEDRLLAELLSRLERPIPVLLVLNKIDLLPADQLPARQEEYQVLLPKAEPVAISCSQGHNLDVLLAELLKRMPPSPPYFPSEQVTDLFERDLAADLLREAALKILRDEVPHGIAVRIDEFTERGDTGAYIEATLFVEKESHKGIVIGQGGGMLKQIGSAARQEIEAMSGRKTFLQIRVKVRKNWRDDEKVLRWFGF